MAEQIQSSLIINPSEYIYELLESARAYFQQVDQLPVSKRKEPETPMDPEDEQESKRSKYRK
jgi:hypothetical protein